jgi:hypothetical protein
VDTLALGEIDLDSLSDGSVIELARRVGVLVEEERQFPDLVRVRLKRNYYEV